jgi:hypothetical protein
LSFSDQFKPRLPAGNTFAYAVSTRLKLPEANFEKEEKEEAKLSGIYPATTLEFKFPAANLGRKTESNKLAAEKARDDATAMGRCIIKSPRKWGHSSLLRRQG